MSINASELILNTDGSIYHLHLLPEQLADTIITVGDPERVPLVSKYFDSIEHKINKREFITHTGYIGNKRLTVISTGIGTDNIDIVLNELDALVNIDLENKALKEQLKSLNIIRIGTSGSLRKEIDVDSILISEMALGMDVLMNFYQRNLSERESRLKKYTDDYFDKSIVNSKFKAYSSEASSFLVKAFESLSSFKGITVTASGFYGPQSRKLRAATDIPDLYNLFDNFEFDGLSVTNLEMETAGIYGMSSILGHKAISLNAILANRKKGTFSAKPDKIVDDLIIKSLEIISDKIIQ